MPHRPVRPLSRARITSCIHPWARFADSAPVFGWNRSITAGAGGFHTDARLVCPDDDPVLRADVQRDAAASAEAGAAGGGCHPVRAVVALVAGHEHQPVARSIEEQFEIA